MFWVPLSSLVASWFVVGALTSRKTLSALRLTCLLDNAYTPALYFLLSQWVLLSYLSCWLQARKKLEGRHERIQKALLAEGRMEDSRRFKKEREFKRAQVQNGHLENVSAVCVRDVGAKRRDQAKFKCAFFGLAFLCPCPYLQLALSIHPSTYLALSLFAAHLLAPSRCRWCTRLSAPGRPPDQWRRSRHSPVATTHPPPMCSNRPYSRLEGWVRRLKGTPTL